MASEKVTGTTSSGFEFSVLKKMLTNAEFLETFAETRRDDMKIFDLATILLGAGQKKVLYDHLRDEDGCVPIETFASEIAEIISLLGKADETKN